MAKTYEDGKHEIVKRLLTALGNVLGTTTDTELANEIGATAASISQWRKGIASPQRARLERMVKQLLRVRVTPLAEIEPIAPHQPAGQNAWQIDRTAVRRAAIKGRLENKRGFYLYYDSRGCVTYVGQAKSNLFFEIEQRLMQKLRLSTHIRRENDPKLHAECLVQGDVVRFFSAYQTVTDTAAHNVEAVLIRALYNNHQNRKSARFR